MNRLDLFGIEQLFGCKMATRMQEERSRELVEESQMVFSA